MKFEVGMKIKIISMNDPYSERYIGKVGIIERVYKDPWGDTRLEGTWGSIALYPHLDTIAIIEDK